MPSKEEQRRDFLKAVGVAGASGTLFGLAGCTEDGGTGSEFVDEDGGDEEGNQNVDDGSAAQGEPISF